MTKEVLDLLTKKKLDQMNSTVLKTLLLLFTISVINAQDFPMTELPASSWDGNWKEAEEILVNPFSNAKTKISNGEGIIYDDFKNVLISKKRFGSFKLSFEFLQDKETIAHLLLGQKLQISLDNKTLRPNAPSGSLRNGKGLLIQAPSSISKEVGLWQKVELIYSAAEPNKSAVLEKLEVNGILLIENYVMSDITAGLKPISFILSKGLLAIRNVKYADYGNEKPISLTNIKYEIQETHPWGRTFELKETAPVLGETNSLNHQMQNDYQEFILTFSGDLLVEKGGMFAFNIDYAGVCSFKVDGKEVVGSPEYLYWIPKTGLIELSEGKHTFEYKYQRIWWPPGFGLFVSGGTFRPYALHDASALPAPQIIGGIYESVKGDKARIIRSFMNFEEKKRTKVISVGTAQNLHYSFDLEAGALLYVWKGDFADVTEMWHDRGEPQLLKPMGHKISLSGSSSFYQTSEDTLFLKEYSLDQNGLPNYLYAFNESTLRQKFEPNEGGLKITISAESNEVSYLLAESDEIKQIAPYLFKTDNYYIQIDRNSKVEIQTLNDKQRLLGKVNEIKSYTLIW